MSEFTAASASRISRRAKSGVLLFVAATMSTACSSTESNPPPETPVSVTREILKPNCDKLTEETPFYAQVTPLRESLTGAKGPAELWTSWMFLQQTVEQNLMFNGIPGERSRIEVSATVGTMLTQARSNRSRHHSHERYRRRRRSTYRRVD